MLLPLLAEFFDELQNMRGRSSNTILAYRRDLDLYCEYREKSSQIPGFYEFMKKRKLSQRSQARVISSLRTYFRFCERHGRKSPELRELKLPQVKLKLPKLISPEDFDKLYEASSHENDHNKTVRNRLALLLLFGLGCRVSELIGISLMDFNPTDRWLKVLGKGGKERILPLTDRLNDDIKGYLSQVRGNLIKKSEKSLLVNDKGHRPSRVDIWRWLAAWSAKAGFKETINPHRFRHGCATALLESGADLRSIQMLLGHSSIQTTQIYTTVTTKHISETIKNHHPMSGMDDLN